MTFKLESTAVCRRIVWGIICCLLTLGLGTASAHAQDAGFGTISGTVTDPNHSVLPSASVTVIAVDTGIRRELQTTSAGTYYAAFLKPGHYEVLVSAAGFTKVDRKGITVLVGQTLTIDAELPVASAQDTVTITGDAPLIDTEKMGASQEISQELFSSVPINGRRFDNVVLMTPNVTPDGSTGLISYRGISSLYNTNLIDGANNNQAFFAEARGRSNGAPYVYSSDSIQEFQSASGTYSAELGQAAGGQVNAITKSGTNQFHGDLFYLLRYPDLNALDSYVKSLSYTATSAALKAAYLTQPVHQQHQFGGSVGGPIIKNKLFFFFTYDGFRKVNPILYVSTAPFSTISADIQSATPGTRAKACATALTNDQCLTALSYLEGNLAGMNGYKLQGQFPRLLKQNIFFPKIDWQATPKNHVTAEFNWDTFQEPNGYNSSNTSSNSSVTQNGSVNIHERFFIANVNTVLTPTSVNQLLFQWARDLETAGENAPGPSVSISSIASYGMPNALPRPGFPDEHRWQVSDIYSKTFGRSTLKAGVDLNFIDELAINLFQGGGIYSYSPGTAEGAFANWVQDVYGVNGGKHYTSFTQVNDPITGIGKDDAWQKVVGAFVDERYKVSPKFQVSAGVRYDIQMIPQPPKPNTTSDLAKLYTSTIHISKAQFQPRIGFNWNPYPTTVVRGGYGTFYGLTQASTYYTVRSENGVFQQQYNATPTTSWAPANLGVLFTPPGPALQAPFDGADTPTVQNTGASLAPLAARGLDPKFSNPYSHSMDLAVDQELPGHLALSIGYVGNRGMRLPRFIDTNVAPATATKSYDVTDASGNTLQTITVPWYTTRVTYATASLLTGFSDMNTWYHSMVVSLKKPMSHGLEVLTNYTWGKTMDEGEVGGVSGTFNGTDVPIDPANYKAEYSRSDLSMKNRFVGSLVWAPTVKTGNNLLTYAAQGWALSGTFTAQTGFPITPMMTNYPTSGLKTAAVSGNGGITGASVSWLNSATAVRAPQLSRNYFAGPGLRNVDARLARDFGVTEKTKLQFYVEAFNLMNHTNKLSVNNKYSTWVASGSGACAGHTNGCIAPYTGTSDFLGKTSSTSGVLYGARQVQFSAKYIF
ncbi:MAG: carboxypeptidase regulatory-like domain-containing protein [Terracidiphilus sp.]|nr:carboxypeptidase regulatory-like domain-containing protein [Terracidiphilus sp.]